MSGPHWRLHKMVLNNILGFLGRKEIVFQKGLQVLHANNHTGKTSLALAILWCLTGQLPTGERITGSKFKLKHKAAGNKEAAWVEVTLIDGKGNALTVRRTLKAGAKTEKLVAHLDGATHEEENAQKLISESLGLNHSTLEGCRIVLQEQRLSLMAGDMKKSSEVIHEILGLTMLSSLVPILNDKISKLARLIKDYEHMDPRAKWEERHHTLVEELREKEALAIKQGCDPKKFSVSSFLAEEFRALSKNLDTPQPPDNLPASECVAKLREELRKKRMHHPLKAKENECTQKATLLKEAHGKALRALAAIREGAHAYAAMANTNKTGIDDIEPHLKVTDSLLASKQYTYNVLKEQHGVFIHSLSLLKKQEDLCSCPVCSQSIDRNSLIAEMEVKVEASAGPVVAELERELHRLAQEKESLGELRNEYRLLEKTMQQSMKDLFEAVATVEMDKGSSLGQPCSPLSQAGAVVALAEEIEAALQGALDNVLTDLAQAKNYAHIYEEKLSPLEQRLDLITTHLIPIHDLHNKLLNHEKCKHAGSEKAEAFKALLEKAKSFHAQLTEFKGFLHAIEKEKAKKTIEEHQDCVSAFFSQVAGNPQYDRIAITAEESYGSVKYGFEALSTQSACYTDAAKHVLSGGDLSCACLGLMLSLMKGTTDKAAFLILDDPGESLDATRIGSLARALKEIGDQQTIILTHQQDLADKLKEAGAATISL